MQASRRRCILRPRALRTGDPVQPTPAPARAMHGTLYAGLATAKKRAAQPSQRWRNNSTVARPGSPRRTGCGGSPGRHTSL
eukprot:4898119-Alexandrium_andersonii.AAC.1